MMKPTTEILFAGFGGHGMLLSGRLLAQAAMEMGSQVSWLPAYGPEMRGGTANVAVCIARDQVGSPYVECPHILVAMNAPSFDKFAPKVKPDGLIVYNEGLVPNPKQRADCTALCVNAQEVAIAAGNIRAANLVMLGVLVGATELVSDDAVIAAIESEFAAKARFIPVNVAAYRAGVAHGKDGRCAQSA